MVALSVSGAHTIGDARCTSFRERLYNHIGNGKPATPHLINLMLTSYVENARDQEETRTYFPWTLSVP
ncbi:unnamed protein product [Rhodiola kirilowii]